MPVPVPMNNQKPIIPASQHHGTHRSRGGGRRNQHSSSHQNDTDDKQNEDTLEAQCRSVAAGVLAGLNANQINSSPSQTKTQATHSVQCHFEGCNKRYKNVNGLRYHMRHVHNRGVTGNAGGGKNSAAPYPPQNNQASPSVSQQDSTYAGRGRGVMMRGGSAGHQAQHHRCRICGFACRTLQEYHQHQQQHHPQQQLQGAGSQSGSSDLRLALTSAPSGYARSNSAVTASRVAAAELLLGGEPPSRTLPFVSMMNTGGNNGSSGGAAPAQQQHQPQPAEVQSQ